MRHLITNVDTSIKYRNLYVSFNIDTEWYPFAEVAFSSLPKNLGQLSVFEIDLLEGCFLEATSFYKSGDKQPDGKIVSEESKFPKTWKIDIEGTLDELRERNKSKLLPFQKIYSVDISDKNSKEPYVKLITTDKNVYFTKVPTFKSLVGLNLNEFALLKGVFISPILYKKGDTSEYNGRFTKITKDDKIVASFNIRIEGTLENNFSLHRNAEMKNESVNLNQFYSSDEDKNDYYRSNANNPRADFSDFQENQPIPNNFQDDVSGNEKQIKKLQSQLGELVLIAQQTHTEMLHLSSMDTNYTSLENGLDTIHNEIMEIQDELRQYGIY